MNGLIQSGSVRAFIAIAVPPPLIEALQLTQRRLEAILPGGLVRWVRPGQLHLTVRFFGGVRHDRISDLTAALGRACALTRPHQLRLQGLGCFPARRTPRVIWAGIGGDLEPLASLQLRIQQETRGIDAQQEERDFKPHLTIGRVKPESPARKIRETIDRFRLDPIGEWLVTEVALVKSELRPEGACHTKLASIRFGASPVEECLQTNPG